MEMDEGNMSQGQRQYVGSDDVVTAYQNYVDVIVIYWPEMKIAGWHRIIGPPVPDTGSAGGGDIYGDRVTSLDVDDWISSLPKC